MACLLAANSRESKRRRGRMGSIDSGPGRRVYSESERPVEQVFHGYWFWLLSPDQGANVAKNSNETLPAATITRLQTVASASWILDLFR
jgi:hypothetical protein